MQGTKPVFHVRLYLVAPVPGPLLSIARIHGGWLGINFNFILPRVNTDYIRQAQVLNIDNLRIIILLMKFLMKKYKITELKYQLKA